MKDKHEILQEMEDLLGELKAEDEELGKLVFKYTFNLSRKRLFGHIEQDVLERGLSAGEAAVKSRLANQALQISDKAKDIAGKILDVAKVIVPLLI